MIHTKQIIWKFGVKCNLEIEQTSVSSIFRFLQLIRQKPQYPGRVRIRHVNVVEVIGPFDDISKPQGTFETDTYLYPSGAVES